MLPVTGKSKKKIPELTGIFAGQLYRLLKTIQYVSTIPIKSVHITAKQCTTPIEHTHKKTRRKPGT